MIGDFNTHKEIGNMIDSSIESVDMKEHNTVLSNSKEIFLNSSEENIKNKKNLIQIEKFKIYFTLKNNGTFYLACILHTDQEEKSLEEKKQKLIFDLIDDVDNQNIKKMVNKNGELTNVGKQNLRFTIDKKQSELTEQKDEMNSDLFESKNSDSSINKISFLNTQINDIQKDVKLSVKNMLNNVNDMREIDNKSEQIKDTSYKFKQDAANLERKLRCRKYLMKGIFYGLLSLPVIYVLYKIFY
jgi:hypothetical protein